MCGGQLACEELSRYFDAYPRDRQFATLIDQMAESFRCEMQRVSARSMGRPVEGDETLARIVVGPRDLVAAGDTVADTVIQGLIGIGYSTLRVEHDPDFAAEICRLARLLVDKAADATPVGEIVYCAGVVEFTARAARDFRIPSTTNRILGAYESPEEHCPSHSDVLLAVTRFPSRRQARLAAVNFFECGGIAYYPVTQYSRVDLNNISATGRRIVLP